MPGTVARLAVGSDIPPSSVPPRPQRELKKVLLEELKQQLAALDHLGARSNVRDVVFRRAAAGVKTTCGEHPRLLILVAIPLTRLTAPHIARRRLQRGRFLCHHLLQGLWGRGLPRLLQRAFKEDQAPAGASSSSQPTTAVLSPPPRHPTLSPTPRPMTDLPLCLCVDLYRRWRTLAGGLFRLVQSIQSPHPHTLHRRARDPA